MLCEKCGVNNATTHIRSIINGEVCEKHLCSSCAVSEGYIDAKNNSLAQMLSNMFGDAIVPDEKKVMRCECCGSSYNDIAKSGKCGCSECYSTFYEQLLPYFKRLHGSVQHIGKKPEKILIETDFAPQIDELRGYLKKLVDEEDYEQAAIVRDKIKSLEEDGSK